KKIPYIPTPKSDKNPVPLKLHLPNTLVIIVSLVAIIYGLWHDPNPYTIFMAAIAGLNIVFMLFTFYISMQTIKKDNGNVLGKKIKKGFWIFRHQLYRDIRKYSLVLSVLVIAISLLAYRQLKSLPWFQNSLPGHQVFYLGLFQPGNDSGLSNMQEIAAYKDSQP